MRTFLKSKTLGTDVFPDVQTEKWYEKLRRDPSRKIYDVDPYVEVYQFRNNLYGLMTHILDTGGFVWLWLIIGPEKAMLIDTSFGVGDLKGLVNEITGGMPLIVANTHCGPDHSYGNCQFDICYCHQLQCCDMQFKQDVGIRDYLTDETGKPIWVDFDTNDFVPFKKYQVVGVPDGYIFDLGQGYEIELVNIPGHQPGHAGYLDRQGRFLIGGDAFPTGGLTGGRDASTDERHAKDRFQWSWLSAHDSMRKCTTLRDALLRLAKRLPEFDRIYCGHGIQGHSSKLIFDMIAACDRIIADPQDYDEKRGDQYMVRIGNTGYMMTYYDNGV